MLSDSRLLDVSRIQRPSQTVDPFSTVVAAAVDDDNVKFSITATLTSRNRRLIGSLRPTASPRPSQTIPAIVVNDVLLPTTTTSRARKTLGGRSLSGTRQSRTHSLPGRCRAEHPRPLRVVGSRPLISLGAIGSQELAVSPRNEGRRCI